MPISKRLSSDEDSNVFVFLTGACARIPPPNPLPTLPYPVQGPITLTQAPTRMAMYACGQDMVANTFLNSRMPRPSPALNWPTSWRRCGKRDATASYCLWLTHATARACSQNSTRPTSWPSAAATSMRIPCRQALCCPILPSRASLSWTPTGHLLVAKKNQLRTFFRLTFRPFHCSLPLLHSTSPHRTCPGLSMRLSQPSQAANSMILGQSLIDQFTDVTLRFMEENLHPGGNYSVTVADLVCSSAYPPPPPARCPD